MSKHKNLKRNLLICLLAGSAVMYTLPLHAATSVIANNTLPSGEQSLTQNHTFDRGNLEMTITQTGGNGIIKWDDFSIGGNATVNFKGPQDGYNTLNYVNGGNVSQIYGTINANNNGNIFIVNPAGVQIGNSAQINVGSLYVSNAKVTDGYLKNFDPKTTVNEFLQNTQTTNAALMSLGNINASKVTFEGDGRIVIDSERIKDEAGNDKLDYQNINITTSADNTDNIIIGYDAYDATNNTYAGANSSAEKDRLVTINGNDYFTKADGYMWVEDVEQLQAINTNLTGNYALRNSIDATGTEQKGFISIGSYDQTFKNAFKGKFDGIDYNIFGLTIKNGGKNTGLFGYTNNATISNVTLVGGSITGSNNVGAIVGSANNTTLTNVVNSAAVSGDSNVGGIVGSANNSAIKDAINTGTINGSDDNVGGLIGNLQNSKLDTTKEVEKGLIGNSYNLGDVSGKGHNVGGLVGSASNSTIGDGTNLVYNRLDVTGAYNVGGIVGNMEANSTVKNAENSGTVLATGHTTENYIYHSDYTVDDHNKHNDEGKDDTNGHYAVATVNVANVGGIAGTSSKSSIENVTNSGDVSSSVSKDNTNIFEGGNVGGVVGRAVDTNIKDATNRENEVRGAHNVGGVAGYFGGTGTVNGGINDGGDIMATGARNDSGFVKEIVRKKNNNGDFAPEQFTVGNIGGIVGYMYGDGVKVTGSANRGTVHTDEPDNPAKVEEWQKAANVGGIVGKIDSDKPITDKNGLGENYINAAVSNSYNTGDVLGYTGVGGIVGMMYNGEVAGSYNLGYIRTTRQSATSGKVIDALNMGGIVGDATEDTEARALIYDVYNKGQIGDENYEYFGRHVGGIVGRLTGTVEKAYNTGAIYNGYNVVGGIVGWMSKGTVKDVFNTGNITVYNQNDVESQVGGIVGAAYNKLDNIIIENAYNLGTIRSFKALNAGGNAVGGILGYILDEGNKKVTISNVYTTGNLYADDGNVGSIFGNYKKTASYKDSNKLVIENANYISPDKGLGFDDLADGEKDNSGNHIEFSGKGNIDEYKFSGGIVDLDGKTGNVDDSYTWRIYDDLPILNAFLPNAEAYFDDKKLSEEGINSIQYGTAYDPLLTIINAKNDLKFNWNELGVENDGGLAVYGAGLTLDNFQANGGSGYFGGVLYADSVLNLNAVITDENQNKISGDIKIGSGADIYGSAVNIKADGKVTIYGDVTATGNGTTSENDPDSGSINITAGDVDVYGTLTSAKKGQEVTVPGISGNTVSDWKPVDGNDQVGNKYADLNTIGERFEYKTKQSQVNGNITIKAEETKKVVTDDDGNPKTVTIGNGNVNLYYGNQEQGLITTGGDLTVTGTGDVYVDSDLDIGGDMTLRSTGADSEVVLDITNIGQVQADNGTVKDALTGLHNFMHHFSDTDGDGNTITIRAENSGDAKLAVDMWNYGTGAFDLNKYDDTESNGHTLLQELQNLNISASVLGNDGKVTTSYDAQDSTYIWVSTAEQLQGIQDYYNAHKNDSEGTGALTYNYALKNDINASDLTNYEAIGTNSANGFTGTFDGRGNRIIGLTVDKVDGKDTANAGIFDTIGTNGVVKDVNIYSGNFTGSANAGAVAGKNNGRIEGVVTFGNTVTSAGNAGGIVGENKGSSQFDENGNLTGSGIYDVESTGSVIAGSDTAVAGGLVGTNNGALGNSFSDSAVTVGTGVTLDKDTTALGGVVGINNGNVQYVDSLGVTNGGATGSSNIGGIIGTNNGNMYSGYNESIVSGANNVGGIIGENDGGINYTVEEDGTVTWNKGTVENVVNATGVTGTGNNVGGLLGTNIGSVENGRNNGTITGNKNVGGMVGSNEAGATLKNLVNDSSAAITGEQYVGGIAGDNAGTITTGNEETDETVNLINRGTITGQQYVGGVAGSNSGTITNANNDVELNVKDSTADAKYFGGIAGVNTGTIKKATNTANVNADGASYVGGIVGQNNGKLEDMAGNSGNVTGKDFVGGVVGENNGNGNNHDPLDKVIASNTGTVIATNGGAGGIFAVNNAGVINSELTNNGVVIGNGTTGTGGIFGVNKGDISKTSLINKIDGQVIGISNVGGLIGVNSGTITGGRNEVQEVDDTGKVTAEKDSYYKYQIYNNGVINVGTWNDADNELTFGGKGTNIGGLIGSNIKETINGVEQTGSLTAGYNTGAINASGSTNVGGIAGSNSGKIDQVFNTVMVADGALDLNGNKQSVAVTGGTNVGGLVGNNSGILNNAYNTTSEVKGNAASTGNLVGTNSGTVQYVYGVADKLIGDGKTAENGYVIDGSDTWLQEGTYDGFTFGANGWKIYDGSTLPMLSVFLTKVTVVDQHLVDQYFSAKHYGEFHQITVDDIKALIAIGAISAPDGFDAFNNNNGLIQGVADDAMANSGNWLYSWQIGSSNINGLFNPNNLGYDISLVYSPFELDDDPSSHWNYLFNDAPFDRNKDFRERKAEVNFVDGGMEI